MSEAIRLLHPVIEITPGQRGEFPRTNPFPDKMAIQGSAILRLTNITARQNAYTVRLDCGLPFWQEEWYTVEALPLPPGTPGMLQPDRPGSQNRSVTLSVPNGLSRDVLIRFNLPTHPNSRAGKYRFEIVVETKVPGPQNEEPDRARITRVPADAIVRPFHQWSAEVRPLRSNPSEAGPRVGRFFRRTAEFEVMVQNSGNDWLYCDLKLPPQPQNLTLTAPTLRIAVRPPERDEAIATPNALETQPGTRRTVPLTARTSLRAIRGATVPQQMPLALIRRDAPSIAYPKGSVTDSPTTETAVPSGPQAIIYHPPIPENLAQLPNRVFGSIRNMIMTLLGLIILLPLLIMGYQHWAYSTFLINPLQSNALPGKPLTVRGKLVQGASFELQGLTKGKPIAYDTLVVKEHIEEGGRFKGDVVDVIMPEQSDGFTGKIVAYQLNRFLPLPHIIFPHSAQPLEIGNVTPVKPSVEIVDAGPYHEKANIVITGHNLGPSGTVLLGNKKVEGVLWSGSKVSFHIPSGLFNPGEDLPVDLLVRSEETETRINAGSLKIAPASAPAQPGGEITLPEGQSHLASGGTVSPDGGGGAETLPQDETDFTQPSHDDGQSGTAALDDTAIINLMKTAGYLNSENELTINTIRTHDSGSPLLLAAKAFLLARKYMAKHSGTKSEVEAAIHTAEQSIGAQTSPGEPSKWAEALVLTAKGELEADPQRRIYLYGDALMKEDDCTPATLGQFKFYCENSKGNMRYRTEAEGIYNNLKASNLVSTDTLDKMHKMLDGK